jgi:hypothetical protein
VPLLGRVTCNRALFPPLIAALRDVERQGLSSLIHTDSGCYAARTVARSPTAPPSQHAYGAAVDINAPENPYGATPTMDPRIVQIFRAHGFIRGRRRRCAMTGTAMKIDLKRELGDLYRAHLAPSEVEVPPLRFLMIDGHGDPDGAAEFRDAIEALYATAYGLKFRMKALDAVDYRVMPLEGLWWIPNARVWDFSDKSDWDWTLMIVQPDEVTPARLEDVRAAAAERRPLPALDRIRLDTFAEGHAVQAMHTGAWSMERPTLERLQAYMATRGLMPVGKHHEIYLSDPSRVGPDRMRTILRQAVAPKP